MKWPSSMKLTVTIAAALIVCSGALPTAAGHAGTISVRNCTWCHGVAARGYPPAPALAGQRQQYIERQLVSFSNHTRDNPFSQQYMWGAAAALDARASHDLAAYFSSLPGRAANDGRRDLVPEGRRIYELGIPEADIPSCLVCHAPNGEGVGHIPRVAGLSYIYLKRRLRQWGEGYHAAAEPPMPIVARNLPPDVIEALASYLSFAR